MEKENLIKGRKVILVIASEGFQPLELLKTREALVNLGVIVKIASNKPGGAVAEDGRAEIVDLPLDDINLSDYDGIFFIGGKGAMKHLDIPVSYKLLCEAKDKEIPYGAIGISVRILLKSFAAAGKKVTGLNDDNAMPIICAQGNAKFFNEAIKTDGLLVTARDKDSSEKFAEGVRRVLIKKSIAKG